MFDSRVQSASFQCLELREHQQQVSNFAFNVNLRHYSSLSTERPSSSPTPAARRRRWRLRPPRTGMGELLRFTLGLGVVQE